MTNILHIVKGGPLRPNKEVLVNKQEIPLAKNINSVSLRINNVCNLKCKSCYLTEEYNDCLTTKFNNPHRQFPTRENYLKLWTSLIALEVGQVVFSAEEPLLTDQSAQYIFDLIKMRDDSKSNMKIGVITNGITLDTYLDHLRLKNNIDSIAVSIDGIQRIHDQNRGQGAYHKAITNAELLNKKSPGTVVIGHTLHSGASKPYKGSIESNLCTFVDLVDDLITRGFSDISVGFYREREATNFINEPLHKINDFFEKQLPKLISLKTKKPFNILFALDSPLHAYASKFNDFFKDIQIDLLSSFDRQKMFYPNGICVEVIYDNTFSDIWSNVRLDGSNVVAPTDVMHVHEPLALADLFAHDFDLEKAFSKALTHSRFSHLIERALRRNMHVPNELLSCLH